MMSLTRLMIVEDLQMFARMLSQLFELDDQVKVVGTAGNVVEALAMAEQIRPDLILLDVKMPGGSGLDLIIPLRKQNPDVKILILSAVFDPYTVQQVVEHDVEGYMEKTGTLSVLQEAVRCVRQGGTFFSSEFLALKKNLVDSPESFHKILSQRDQYILQLMSEGLSDGEIAVKKGIAVQTVATNRKRIRAKLGLHSDRELLAYARRWGLGGKAPEHTN